MGGSGKIATVWFVPAPSSGTPGTLVAGAGYGTSTANLQLNILPFLNAVVTTCGSTCSAISTSSWYFEGPETGSEFGGKTAPDFTATDSNLLIQMCTPASIPAGHIL